MEVSSTRPPGNDLLLAARERLSNGPVPEWVSTPAFAAEFRSKQSDCSTCLLLSQQVHAELNQTHVHVVERLENMQGVQDLSQWRLPFEPLTMSVTIHWIRIRRGNHSVDQGFVDRFRLLQREERLEGCIIDGWITLLLLLEDVRPGDLLDACYTIERQARFLPDHCSCFFALPEHHPVGKFHFSLRFKTGRPMKWKSSGPQARPVVESGDQETLWSWSGTAHEPGNLEDNIPEWYPTYPWLQLSDCADWGVVSQAIANGWKKEPEDPAVLQLANEIAQRTPEISARVEKALRLIQDEFRYLSLSMELGGRIPSPPGGSHPKAIWRLQRLEFLTRASVESFWHSGPADPG